MGMLPRGVGMVCYFTLTIVHPLMFPAQKPQFRVWVMGFKGCFWNGGGGWKQTRIFRLLLQEILMSWVEFRTCTSLGPYPWVLAVWGYKGVGCIIRRQTEGWPAVLVSFSSVLLVLLHYWLDKLYDLIMFQEREPGKVPLFFTIHYTHLNHTTSNFPHIYIRRSTTDHHLKVGTLCLRLSIL